MACCGIEGMLCCYKPVKTHYVNEVILLDHPGTGTPSYLAFVSCHFGAHTATTLSSPSPPLILIAPHFNAT